MSHAQQTKRDKSMAFNLNLRDVQTTHTHERCSRNGSVAKKTKYAYETLTNADCFLIIQFRCTKCDELFLVFKNVECVNNYQRQLNEIRDVGTLKLFICCVCMPQMKHNAIGHICKI